MLFRSPNTFALLANAFYKLICPYVCVSVCVFTFEVLFNFFLYPLPKVRCPKILELWNPWGKIMEEGVSHLKTFTNKGCKITAQKKFVFGSIWQGSGGYIQQGSGGYSTRIKKLYNKDHEVFSRIFLVSVLLSALVKRCFIYQMWDFKTAPNFFLSHPS